jgi:hypothetical protein
MTIKEILIPGKIDQCTMDVPFIISRENIIVFLTNEGILRRNSFKIDIN